MNWADFAAAAHELAALGRVAFEEQHLAILGTLRANGWPRISPCEVYFVDGEMMFSMMPDSKKVLDLRRDPRITVVNGQTEQTPKRGDFKLYGRAREVLDQPSRDALADAQEAAINWRPTDPFNVFAVSEIHEVSYISFGAGHRLLRWTPEGGFERLAHPEG